MTDERSDAWLHQAVQYERISPAFAKEVADALAANAATIAAQAADLLDAAMLIRRLAHRCPGLAVAHQATDWLKRKGLQGSILRETEDSNG